MAAQFESQLATGGSTSNQNTTGTITVSGATANRTLVAILSVRSGSGGSFTDDTGNWNKLDEHAGASTSGAMFYRIATGTTADDFDASWPNSREWAVSICEYSGLATSSVLNQNAEYTANADTSQTSLTAIGPVTATPTTQPGLAVIGGHSRQVADAGYTSVTVDNSFTNIQGHDAGAGGDASAFQASKRYTSTSAINGSWTPTISGSWRLYVTLGLFNEAAGGGAVSGSGTPSESADTSSASGAVTGYVTGTATPTEAADTSTASGSLGGSRTGTASPTESADTSTASGVVSAQISGSVAITEVADIATASGTRNTSVTGTATITESADYTTTGAVDGYLPSIRIGSSPQELRRKRNARYRYLASQ